MSNKNKKLLKDNSDKDEFDPLDELNTIDKFTSIQTEKDPLDELDLKDVDSFPEYDSKSGTIVETPNENKNTDDSETEANTDNTLINVIEEVDVNSKKDDKKDKPKLDNSSNSLRKEEPNNKTKVIDNVKVDENGVPLLNQFDTSKIKHIHFFDKLNLNKQNLLKIAMVLAGAIIVLIGVLEALTEVVTVSDHVMYGEHESFAIGIILIGMIVIILAFYNEIIKFLGLNAINSDLTSDNTKYKSQKIVKKDKKDK